MHKYTFFSGKGGVGKTTLAAATAVRTAQSGKRTLIVSTDPASNLADVFERPIGPRVTEIASFDRFTDFLGDTEFDHVVFDTAPTGHTLRLLELPYDYARQVEMIITIRKDDAGATGAKKKLDALVRRLKDPPGDDLSPRDLPGIHPNHQSETNRRRSR